MAIPDYRLQSLTLSYKAITIEEVNTERGYIQGSDTSRQPIRCSFRYYFDPFTAVPRTGEVWLVHRIDNDWVLHSRFEKGDEGTPIRDLKPGDRRISAPNGILYIDANQIIFNDNAINGALSGSAFVLPLTLVTDIEQQESSYLELKKNSTAFPKFALKENLQADNNIGLYFGNGASVSDVSLYRSESNTLTLNGNLHVSGVLSIGPEETTIGGSANYNTFNYEVKRDFNARDTTIHEIADILATLIEDLGLRGN